MANWYKTLPNWITFIRLVLIPVFVWVLVEPSRNALNTAAVIFVFAAISDYADGWLARRYKAVTDFGKLFDPLADKILVMAALVMLVQLRDDQCQSFVPGWMVVLILARELWITGLRAFAARDGSVIAAKAGGKVKSFLQMVSILALLLHDYSFHVMGMRFTWQFVGLNLLVISLAFSYVSAVDYSLMILAPNKGTLADLSRRVGASLLGDKAPAEPAPGRTEESADTSPKPSDDPQKGE